MWTVRRFFLFFFFFFAEDTAGEEIQTHIERLHEKLLSADVYDKTLRPLPTSNKTTATLIEASFPHRHIVSVVSALYANLLRLT